jgi:hypothetical protein
MKTRTRIILFCMGLLTFLTGSASAATTNKLDELVKLPFGLQVVHTPDKVRADHDGPSGRAFTWSYKTSVTATNGSVVIVEFGSFIWHKDKWVFSSYTGKPFTSQDFADWYSCPGAKLVEGQTFSDGSNWSGGDILRADKMRWYYIGVTPDGHRVKGEAVVEILPEVSSK